MKSIAVYFAKYKIRVNAISPTGVMAENLKEKSENLIDFINSLHPVGRIGYPKDIAWAAVYPVTDEAKWVYCSVADIAGDYSAVKFQIKKQDLPS